MKIAFILIMSSLLAIKPTSIFASLPVRQVQTEKKDTVDAYQFFIQILPDKDLVKCGRFREFDTLEVTKIFFIKNDSVDQWTIDEALSLIYERQHGQPLFYVHGFYAASPKLTQRTVLAYKKFFLKDSTNHTTDIVHIVWASNKLSYKNSRKNIRKSRQSLAKIILDAAQKRAEKINLMCHSMGNQFLMETIKAGMLTENRIDKLILAAPDFDMADFDIYHKGVGAVANQVLVLYNKKDKILAVSRWKNQERRLGQRLPKRVDSDNFIFKDCSKMKISHSFMAKVNRHTYFLASDGVREIIHQFLAES